MGQVHTRGSMGNFTPILIAIIAILIGLTALPAHAQAKTVFAHYMVTNQDYQCDDPTDNPPEVLKIEAYEKEIVQAKTAGFDGFALNCGGWYSQTYYITYATEMFEAAVDLNNGFKLMFSCDFCCGNGVNDAEDMMRRFCNNPTYAPVYFQYNGSYVLSTFSGDTQIGTSGFAQIKSDLANGTNTLPAPTGFTASSDAPMKAIVVLAPFWGGETPQAASDIQSSFDEFEPDIDGVFYWGIAGVPGSGGSIDNVLSSEVFASVVEPAGKIYMAPVCFQFWGADASRYFEYSGFSGYRKMWMDAINVTHPNWVENVTWNDFIEGTYVAQIDDPSKYPYANFLTGSGIQTWSSPTGPPLGYWHSHYAASDLAGYFIQWYKTGVQPTIGSDEVFWAYRTQPMAANAGTPNIGTINGPEADVIYVTCNLAAPATLTINSGGTISTLSVAAGSNDYSVPFAVGNPPTFTLTRNGATVWSGAGTDPIQNPPVFSDNSTTVGGGNGEPATQQLNDLYYSTGDSGPIPYNEPPSTPTNLTATSAPGGSAVNLSWTGSTGSTPLTYNVYRGTSSGGESSTPIASGVSSTSYTDSTAVNGTKYYYTVKGVNSLGTSAASNEASATPVAPTLASVPTGLTATASDASIALSWSASTGTAPITYNILRGTSSGGETTIKTGVTGTTYTDTGLANGTTYYYKVSATNVAGTSANSSEVSAKTLTAVYQIDCGSGTAVSPYVADEYFSAGNEYSSGATITTSGVYNPAPAAVYQTVRWLSSFNYTIPGLTSGSSYLVRLHFCELSFTGAGDREFNVAINGSTVLTNFDVYTTAGGQNIAVEKDFTTTANSSGQIVIAFSQGAADNPEIAGIEIYGGAGASQSPPSAPTNLTATGGNAQVSLSWTGSSGATSYNVYRGTSSGGESSTPIATGLTGTTYTNTGLTNGTTYYYKVAAVNAAGTSGMSNEANATPSTGVTVPSAPTNLTASAGNAQAALSWTASSGATSYNVYRGTTAGGESSTAIATGITGTTYTNTGLTNGTTYYYKVAAVNTAGTSGMSNEASATPAATQTQLLAIDCGSPSAVSPFVADVDFNTGSEFSSTAAINTSGVTNPAPAAVYQTVRWASAFTYTIPGLTSGTSYTVRLHFCELTWTAAGQREFNVAINGTNVLTNFDVFATAGAQNKAVIEQFTATANSSGQIVIAFTQGAADNPEIAGIEIDGTTSGSAPSAPANLTATGALGQVALTWSPSAGATSYNVYRGTTSGGESSTALATGITSSSYTDSTAASGTTYYYKVAAVNSYGTSAKSSEASAKSLSAVVQIDCGSPSAVSPFVADEDFSAGNEFSSTATINTSGVTNPAPATVYQTVRWNSSFNYTIPNLTAGSTYTVRLHFCELTWTAAGQREFNVAINGTTVLTNFDVFATAGAENKAVIEQFTATANSSGQIVVAFTQGAADNPEIAGLEVLH